MIENDLLEVQRFIPSLIEKQNELSAKRINSAKPLLRDMFIGLVEIQERRQSYIKENAPYFNIFNIIRYGHYETRLHTPFLVHLLTPNGHHQIGSYFFNLFINHIYKERTEPFIESELKNIHIHEEFTHNMLDGQIDIFIHFTYRNERFNVVVENKINASDGKEQLKRYYDFLKVIMHKHENTRLIYLTKYGLKPSIPYSISYELYEDLEKKRILKLLSYTRDITEWIKVLLNEGTPQSVREILRQYLNTIK